MKNFALIKLKKRVQSTSCGNRFVIKQLAKGFNGYFNCISENTKKNILLFL